MGDQESYRSPTSKAVGPRLELDPCSGTGTSTSICQPGLGVSSQPEETRTSFPPTLSAPGTTDPAFLGETGLVGKPWAVSGLDVDGPPRDERASLSTPLMLQF